MAQLRRAATAGILILGCISASSAGSKKTKAPSSNEDAKRAVHVLNRLTFGPRPGDVDRVRSMGIDKWIDEQLHPEKIDDSAVQQRLANFLTLKMNAHELAEKFPPNPVIKQVAEGRIGMPHNPDEKLVYLAAVDRYELRAAKKGKTEKADDQPAAENADDAMEEKHEIHEHGERIASEIAALPPDQRIAAMLRLSSDDRRDLQRISNESRTRLTDGMSPADREAVLAMRNPAGLVGEELVQAKLLRAIYSNRQLEEVMSDFWFNHFNVYLGKGPDRYYVTEYEREAIRPHALGKFKDLLSATAHNPAMLFYLDNAESVGPHSPAALGMPEGFGRPMYRGPFGGPVRPPQPKKNQQKGLNENYARELMELHTLGVNGGYTQQDVTEVAKVFTGWTIEEPRKGGGFHFAERRHEPGVKYVLGTKIKENGEKEGEEVLAMLARDAHTAKFVCNKIAMRFVSDTPPPSLVDRMVDTWEKKDGDIREVLRTMLKSPEFWAPEAYRAKVKTPLEFVVSAMRATDADVTDARPLAAALNQMGMPLYRMQPPTGYSMKAETWVNSAALLSRMNFALGLGAGKIKGSNIAPELLLGKQAPEDATAIEETMENDLLAGDVSEQTRKVIQKQFNDPQILAQASDGETRARSEAVMEGLILGSPEFQRR